MQPYNTQKRKIDTFQNIDIDYSIQEELQRRKNALELDNIRRDIVYQYQFKKVLNVSTEWVDLVQEENFGVPEIELQYQTWILEFETFDIRLLPFINVQILIKNSANEEANLSRSMNNLYFEVTDIEGETYYKKLKIITNIFLTTEFVDSEEPGHLTVLYQGRTVVTFINPKEYI